MVSGALVFFELRFSGCIMSWNYSFWMRNLDSNRQSAEFLQGFLVHYLECSENYQWMLGYARSLCSAADLCPSLAYDFVQETEYLALRKVSSLRDELAIKAWLRIILRNVFLSFLRKDRRRFSVDFLPSPLDGKHEISPPVVQARHAEALHLEELRQVVFFVLMTLPDLSRKVFELSSFEEKQNGEIAEELHLNDRQVSSRLSRARRKVARVVRTKGWGFVKR